MIKTKLIRRCIQERIYRCLLKSSNGKIWTVQIQWNISPIPPEADILTFNLKWINVLDQAPQIPSSSLSFERPMLCLLQCLPSPLLKVTPDHLVKWGNILCTEKCRLESLSSAVYRSRPLASWLPNWLILYYRPHVSYPLSLLFCVLSNA